MRPVAGALSIGVVALVIWNKVTVPAPPEVLHPPETAKVYGSADAPVAQLDLSRVTSGTSGSESQLSDARSLEIDGRAPVTARQGDRVTSLQNDGAPDHPQAKAGGSSGARAAGRPIDPNAAGADSSELQLTDRTRLTMTEEERSARNEEMFKQLEKQKKQMGLKILPKDEHDDEAGVLGLRKPPPAPVLHAPVPALLESAKPQGAAASAQNETPISGPGRLAPDAALVFTDAGSVASSWVLLGLPGKPPATDFTNGRLVMIKPSATKILSVTAGPDAVTVVYRSLLPDEDSDPARDRTATLPASPKAVLIYDASPR